MTIARISVRPIDHFVGARFSRRRWHAVLVAKDGTEQSCGHTSEGHTTTDAAATCGRALWKALAMHVDSQETTVRGSDHG